MTVSKLSGKLKNVPTDTSLVCSSTKDDLNRVERLSDRPRVLADNLGEENPLRLRTEEQHSRVAVYVLNMRGQPLMPTTPRKARLILQNYQAKVVYRTPFTIQLNYATGENKQEITLGIDAGYSKIGFSAITKYRELIAGEVSLRTDLSKKLTERRMYRRARRNKLWYRKSRFLNRVSVKKKDWLAPSILHKLETHIRLIEKINFILPISRTIIEQATFDTHKMHHPEITGIEYQQGELQGYEVREYLLTKWGRKCAYCDKSGVPLEIEHIIPKSRGGTNRVANLTLSCRKCNQKKGNQTAKEFGYPAIAIRAKRSLKAAVFMNSVRKQMIEQLNCYFTFGFITKYLRIRLGLAKSHVNDAFVIAGGSTQLRSQVFTVQQIRRNNRSLQMNRKGFKPSIRRQRYTYQPNDLVRSNHMLCRVKGVFNYGKWVRLVTSTGSIINSSLKKVKLINYGKGLCFTINSST
jgi:5-methylcytosine-specific restriction endonuclease McrA